MMNASESSVRRFESGGVRVYRLEAPVLPHLNGYVYLALGGAFPPTLIDAGGARPESLEAILSGLGAVSEDFGERFAPAEIERIIVTHAHLDHFGGANELARRFGAEVWAHRFDARIVASYNERASVANARYRPFLLECGVEPERVDSVIHSFGFLPGRARSVPVVRFLDDGQMDGPFRFYHFPGHSAGLLAVELGGFLFSADLILSKTLTQIWPERLIPYTGLGHYLDSLDRLERLAAEREERGEPLTLLPGHEEPIPKVGRRIELVRKSNERRNGRLLDLIDRAEEPPTIHELAGRMYLTSHINRTFFALCDVAARIEYLELEGEIAAANYDEIAGEKTGAIRYCRVRRSEQTS